MELTFFYYLFRKLTFNGNNFYSVGCFAKYFFQLLFMLTFGKFQLGGLFMTAYIVIKIKSSL